MDREKQSLKFDTPQEELEYLREQVASKERALEDKKVSFERESVISDQIKEYTEVEPEQILSPDYKLPKNEAETLATKHELGSHDHAVSSLFTLLEEKGIRNTLSVVERMEKPDVTDDFHRELIQYIKAGSPVKGLKEGMPLWNILHMTLYEVFLPRQKKEETKQLGEFVAAMEQFYMGMLSVADENRSRKYMSVELALADKSDAIIFYIAVPDTHCDLFEKQLQSLFPDAQMVEQKNDYNIFVENGVSIGSQLYFRANGIFPIKTYDQFEHDPFNVILNAFSKIETEGGGAALQLVFNPTTANVGEKFKHALERIKAGVPVKDAINIGLTESVQMAKSLGGLMGELAGLKKKPELNEDAVDQTVVDAISGKIQTPIIGANVRIVASAKSRERAMQILSDIEAAFNQFNDTQSNGFMFRRSVGGGKLNQFLKAFSFREFLPKEMIPMSVREFATVIHLPLPTTSSSPQFKEATYGGAAAPIDLPQSGLLLGSNKFRNIETKVYLTQEDRLRHLYVIGQTGTGKTTFLKNLIAQDIKEGEGVCFIDPHGTDIVDVLGLVPEERAEDVIYFDPSSTDGNVLGLNMLEYDRTHPEQKSFVVNELFSIFRKLYSEETMGPIFEQYFRNATMLVLEDPTTVSTLMDVPRVLADEKFRALKISRCKNPVITQFWKEIAAKAGGESSLQNMVPYITSKFDVFLADDIIRPIIAQEKSAFNFREIMDNKKILLVNLAKGRLGDINANLIGLILVGKILMAALSRVDSTSADMPPLYLYIDEFQNITTNSIAAILSEARKYKLSLTIAHQFIAQLDQGIRDAVFGNVGSLAVFRVGTDDAQFLENQFEGVCTFQDLMNIENHNAYVKLLAGGIPAKPFTIQVPAPKKGETALAERIKQLSGQKYGRPREEVEKYIRERYGK